MSPLSTLSSCSNVSVCSEPKSGEREGHTVLPPSFPPHGLPHSGPGGLTLPPGLGIYAFHGHPASPNRMFPLRSPESKPGRRWFSVSLAPRRAHDHARDRMRCPCATWAPLEECGEGHAVCHVFPGDCVGHSRWTLGAHTQHPRSGRRGLMWVHRSGVFYKPFVPEGAASGSVSLGAPGTA